MLRSETAFTWRPVACTRERSHKVNVSKLLDLICVHRWKMVSTLLLTISLVFNNFVDFNLWKHNANAIVDRIREHFRQFRLVNVWKSRRIRENFRFCYLFARCKFWKSPDPWVKKANCRFLAFLLLLCFDFLNDVTVFFDHLFDFFRDRVQLNLAAKRIIVVYLLSEESQFMV